MTDARRILTKALRSLGFLDQAREGAARGQMVRDALLKRFLVPLHRDEPVEPFFIVGCGRSGTTLLRRMLMAGDEVHIPPENWHLGAVLSRFRARYRLLEWQELVHLVAARFTYQGEGSQRVPKWWFETGELYPLLKQLAALPEPERSLARLVDGIYRYHGSVRGATPTRWGDKTPYNRKFMFPILEAFPKARFVYLVRDGTDVVSSWLKLPGYDLQERAEAWKQAVHTLRHFTKEHPEKCLEVRYERLVRHPADTLESVCQFLSLDFSPAMVENPASRERMNQVSRLPQHENVFKPVSSSHIGKGHHRLSSAQKAEVADLIGDALKDQGCDLPS